MTAWQTQDGQKAIRYEVLGVGSWLGEFDTYDAALIGAILAVGKD